MSQAWLAGALAVGLLIVGVSFAVATDGRYYGKPLVHWLYDRIGPAVFGMQSERRVWRTLAAELDLEGAAWLLDLGTALGDLPITMAEVGEGQCRTIGLERSIPMAVSAARAARARSLEDRVGFIGADVRQPLPFASGTISVVSALGLLETIRQPESLLAEMVRILEPGGTLLLSVYRGPASWLAALGEAWYRDQLDELIQHSCRRIPLRNSHDVLIVSSVAA
jgi:ubiquinone/menaquinone biosynthesis C-methylase UbiE